MLSNLELFYNLFKITLGMGTFNRPFLYFKFGMTNSIVGEILSVFMITNSFRNMVDCIEAMPSQMHSIKANLTIGKVVEKIID